MAVHHSTKKLNLTGQRYGKLAVLGPAENVGSRTAWRCLCDCGRETVATTQRLRDGRCTSCGCDKPSCAPAAAGRASLTFVDGTCLEMIRAGTVRRNNTSGVPGVDWVASKGLWRAVICFKGRRHYLGSYGRFEDAVKARKKAERELFEPFLEEYDRKSVNM